ncbi:hypothetical protein ACFVHB_04610 [Kitasatospora sp. NPDC127111]|uniref:hypothetical protein n=1 Tax=Kitasatospora sp. NPDC127111 TaxID=3345363 RepID=UPI003634AF9B
MTRTASQPHPNWWRPPEHLSVAALVPLVVPWPVAYLLRPARVRAAPAPGAALAVAVFTISSIRPGS